MSSGINMTVTRGNIQKKAYEDVYEHHYQTIQSIQYTTAQPTPEFLQQKNFALHEYMRTAVDSIIVTSPQQQQVPVTAERYSAKEAKKLRKKYKENLDKGKTTEIDLAKFANSDYMKSLLDEKVKNCDLNVKTQRDLYRKCREGQFNDFEKLDPILRDTLAIEYTKEKMSTFPEGERIEAKIEDVSKKMPYKAKTFDFVYARLVLHYLTKQQLDAALKEIYRVMKPNGKIFIVARNNKEWEIKRPEYVVSYDEKTNMTAYYEQWKKEAVRKRQFLSQQQLKSVLVEHGFKILSAKDYRERLYTDYERTSKNKSKKPNYLTEVVAQK